MSRPPASLAPSGRHVRLTVPLSADLVEEHAAATQGRTVQFVELAGLSQSTTPVSFGAEARLLGWLARQNLARARPDLMFPPSVRGDSLPAGATSELAYYLLGRMSGRVVHNGADRTRELRKAQVAHLEQNQGTLATPDLRVYFYDHQMLGLPLLDAIARRPDELPTPALKTLLANGLTAMGLTGFDAPTSGPSPVLLKSVRDFAAETLENARVHATRDLRGERIPGLAYMSIKRYHFREQRAALAGTTGPLADYFSALQRSLRSDLSDTQFAEFTVADSGVGISAHYGSRVNIYASNFDDEATLVRRAFRMSEEAPAGSWAGVGLSKVQEATRDLRAFLAIRTGRVEATKHFIDAPDDDLLSITIRPDARALLGGTALTLLVPWIPSEPQLPFELS